MQHTKRKALSILELLESHKGCKVEVLESYRNAVNTSEDSILITMSDRSIEILVGSFYYLYIYPDNTVRCNEDGWGMSMYFEVDIFNRVMEL